MSEEGLKTWDAWLEEHNRLSSAPERFVSALKALEKKKRYDVLLGGEDIAMDAASQEQRDEILALTKHAGEVMDEWLPGYVDLDGERVRIDRAPTNAAIDTAFTSSRISQEYFVSKGDDSTTLYKVRVSVSKVM